MLAICEARQSRCQWTVSNRAEFCPLGWIHAGADLYSPCCFHASTFFLTSCLPAFLPSCHHSIPISHFFPFFSPSRILLIHWGFRGCALPWVLLLLFQALCVDSILIVKVFASNPFAPISYRIRNQRNSFGRMAYMNWRVNIFIGSPPTIYVSHFLALIHWVTNYILLSFIYS